MEEPRTFFDLPDGFADYGPARVCVLQAPWERTTSYGKGASDGPSAILEASHQVEFWEEWTRSEPYRLGVASLPPVSVEQDDAEAFLAALEGAARPVLEDGKFLVTLGGEHTVTLGSLAAVRAVHGDVGVVQFDAHADLRDTYEESRLSHACVMRRALEAGHSTLGVGVRALCREEAELIASRRLATIWGWELSTAAARFGALLDTLPQKVYLTFDVDYFDPMSMPATGTPVPGGGEWYPTLALLRTLFARKQVVAMDVVELAPRPDLHACDFLAASLVYKSLAFLAESGD